MRPALLVSATLALVVLGAAAASVTGPDASRDGAQGRGRDDEGLSLPALSRCAGIAGTEMRAADPAFGLLMLDGAPWMALQRDHDAVLLTSTGSFKRRNGTTASFRFSCLLDERGRAVMFRAALVEPNAATAAALPPSRLVVGAATLATTQPLPRGAELRLQLIDIGRAGEALLLAEQVVRSGWETPIPFALRLPAETKLEGRKLALAARVTVARKTVFAMAPRALAPQELAQPATIRLDVVN